MPPPSKCRDPCRKNQVFVSAKTSLQFNRHSPARKGSKESRPPSTATRATARRRFLLSRTCIRDGTHGDPTRRSGTRTTTIPIMRRQTRFYRHRRGASAPRQRPPILHV